MTEKIKINITHNYSYLVDNTINVDKLLNLLLQNSIIDFVDYETIRNEADTSRDKSIEIYLTLLKKDDVSEESLLASFNESGNWVISKRLTKKTSDIKMQQIWFDVKMPANVFVGRNAHIQKLHELWQLSYLTKKTYIAILSGLGGVGKTEIVKNYARKFFEEEEGHCISINTENVESQIESFKRLANEMGVSGVSSSGNEKDLDSLVADIYKNLCDTKSLLIFDNVNSFEDPIFETVQNLSDSQSPETTRPFVIITSRCNPPSGIFRNALVNNIPVDILPLDSAAEFVTQALDENSDAANVNTLIQNICSRLNCFPLALKQAVAYLNSSSEAIQLEQKLTQFLNLLEKDSIKCLNFPISNQYSSTTYLTLKCTLEKLNKYPAVTKIMNNLAFFAAEDISIPLMIKVLNSQSESLDESAYLKAIHLLTDYSLISTNWKDNKISIHRLVQEILRIDLESQNQTKDTIEKLINIFEKDDIIEVVKRDQIQHVRSAWHYANAFSDLVKQHCNFPGIICGKYEELGLFYECEDFAKLSLDLLCSKIEEKSASLLWLNYWRGCALEGLGKLDDAILLFRETYEKAKTSLGEENDLTLRCAHVNGSVLWRQGKNAEAMNWYQTALRLREKIFGADNEHTLVLKNDMALILGDENKYNESLKLYYEILNIREKLMGKEHSETLTVKHNIGWIKYCQKDYQGALKVLEETLQAKLRVLHYNHPNVLSTKHVMGRTLKEMGRYKEALQILKDAYEGRQKVLGSDHPNTINSKNLVEAIEKAVV